MATAEEQARQQQQQERDRQAASHAVAGAQAVADAVKRVADDAVQGARGARASALEGNFLVSGTPGGRFTIRGNGFTGSGTVLLNGKQLETTEWSNERIAGKLPSDARPGEVVVVVDETKQFRAPLRF